MDGFRHSARLSSKPVKRYSDWDSDYFESQYCLEIASETEQQLPAPVDQDERMDSEEEDPEELIMEPEEEEGRINPPVDAEQNGANQGSGGTSGGQQEAAPRNAARTTCRSAPPGCRPAPRGFQRMSPLGPEFHAPPAPVCCPVCRRNIERLRDDMERTYGYQQDIDRRAFDMLNMNEMGYSFLLKNIRRIFAILRMNDLSD